MSNWEPPPPGMYGEPAYSQPKTEGTAIASLVLGIVGLIGCAIVAPVLAIILGTQAKNKIRQNPSLQGAGLAQAGFVLGIVGLVLDAVYIAYLAAR